MRRGGVAFLALTLIGLGVTGCGLFHVEQREPWREQAEAACLSQGLVQPSAYMSRSSPIEGPGACGISYPFKVTALAGGSVGLSSRGTLACPIIPTIDAWLSEVVQPAAALYFGTPVAEVKSGSYSCRPRNSRSGAKLSEHAFGNALDVMGFRLADGREVSVVRGWRGAPEEQEFLREVFVGACGYFNTVLGPGADVFHYNHFHLDLARHDPRGRRRVCKPVLKFEPRLEGGALLSRRSQPDAARSYEQPEIDFEEDHDPYSVSAAPRAKPAAGTAAAPVSRPPVPAWDRAPVAEGRFASREPLPPVASPPLPPSRSTAAAPLPPLPSPLPPSRSTAAAAPLPSLPSPLPSSRSGAAVTSLPPPPAPPARGFEPIPPYEPPPAQRSAPLVLQPGPRARQPIY